jgi:hypothetical protein
MKRDLISKNRQIIRILLLGSLGPYECGVLAKHDIEFDIIAGTSAFVLPLCIEQ